MCDSYMYNRRICMAEQLYPGNMYGRKSSIWRGRMGGSYIRGKCMGGTILFRKGVWAAVISGEGEWAAVIFREGVWAGQS